tara:strand:- start:695 stop:1450 length:756 start_codon:yes stop_codon:yes gene_type:complete
MAVKVGKLWSKNAFIKLTNNSKLFYIYLATNPNISSVGVISLNLELVKLQIGLSVEEVRESTRELKDNKLADVKVYDKELYFIVKAHFDSVPKSDTSILRINKDLDLLPEGLRDYLNTVGITTTKKIVKFIEPTETEVMDYTLSMGYQIKARTFIEYYRGKGKEFGKEGQWLNWKGKPVRDWKATLRNVWFKDENKLKVVSGAPKGYESWYINFEGQQVFPESWKDGKPHSKNIAVTNALKREYEKRKANS